MIYHILYISEETNPHTDNEIIKLLEKSQRRNENKELTGLLIKNGKYFIQLLEGKQSHVQQLYDIIVSDSRHHRVKTILSYSDGTRLFPNWSMGLVNVSNHPESIAELITIIHSDVIKLPNYKEKILSILKKFNNNFILIIYFPSFI